MAPPAFPSRTLADRPVPAPAIETAGQVPAMTGTITAMAHWYADGLIHRAAIGIIPAVMAKCYPAGSMSMAFGIS